MSHPEQRQLIEIIKSEMPEYFSGGRVVEVGSLDIDGSV
jgi:hypothetical protein